MDMRYQSSVFRFIRARARKRFLIQSVAIFLFWTATFSAVSAEDTGPAPEYQPVILEFRELIENDSVVRMYISEMIDQVPQKHRNIKDVHDFLNQLNSVLTTAPEYHSEPLSILPLTKIILHTMSTPAGLAAYRNEKMNVMLRKVLRAWAEFLNSPKSLYVLNDSPEGWKSEQALKHLNMNDYLYDPDDRYWGFKSWNDFFTRKLAPGARPTAEPRNGKVIVSACDSVVYQIKDHVKKWDDFWIKSQPYSLNDMLANDEYAEQFTGGTVFQSFLNIFDYHRFHSPVSGVVKKAYIVNGLYFSKIITSKTDRTAQKNSQGYLTNVQTRALIFIEADDPEIGLVCVMPVGMLEISSCIINPEIKPGYHIDKGRELGRFQLGGSTCCLIFRPGVIKEFTVKREAACKVGEQIAIAH